MAFKFNKTDADRLQGYFMEAQDWEKQMEDLVREYDEKLAEAAAALNTQVERYNEFREAVRQFIEDMHADMSNQYEDKSESWQEGDRGQATYSWLQTMEEFQHLEPIEEVAPESCTIIEQDSFVTDLGGIETEPSY